MGGTEAKGTAGKALIRIVGGWIFLPLFFLVTGGSFRWWEAWVWCAVVLVPLTLFAVWMMRKDPDFIARRLKMRERERPQRRILAIGVPFYVGVLVLPGLDHRFGWSAIPAAVAVAALGLSLGSYLMILRVFVENRWAGRTVEVCEGQKVVSTGPYAVVRHPMYTGTLILWLATPVALGSWWALLPSLAMVPILVLRIRHEEEVLARELTSYDEYRRKVRYRLLPRVW
jgi:protein-S-isoprenylcysteine O-methyltransferase Ste14